MPHAHPSGFPPRSFDLREKCTPTKAVFRSGEGSNLHGEGQALALRVKAGGEGCAEIGMARDRPSPYGLKREAERVQAEKLKTRRTLRHQQANSR